MSFMSPKAPPTTAPLVIKEDPIRGEESTNRARARAALAARAGGKSRFRVALQPDVQTPAGQGGLQVGKK